MSINCFFKTLYITFLKFTRDALSHKIVYKIFIEIFRKSDLSDVLKENAFEKF